jgi:hypothetical protein
VGGDRHGKLANRHRAGQRHHGAYDINTLTEAVKTAKACALLLSSAVGQA